MLATEKEPTVSEKDYWLLGSNAIAAGSLHCDLWRGPAADLASHDAIAIYPVGGWWKSHLGQKRMSDKAPITNIFAALGGSEARILHADHDAMFAICS